MDSINFRKSSYSGGQGGDCIAVGNSDRTVHIMDTKDADGRKLAVPASAWSSFTRRVQRDQ